MTESPNEHAAEGLELESPPGPEIVLGGKRYRYFGPDGKGGLLLVGMPNGPDNRICVITTDLAMARLTPERVHEMLEHR